MYKAKLKIQLSNFDPTKAECLSDQLHLFEHQGGNLTKSEERLWSQLTLKILLARDK